MMGTVYVFRVRAPLKLGSRFRARSTAAAADVEDQASEWERAKPFNEIPGPKALPLLGNAWRFLTGVGSFDASNLFATQLMIHKGFGDIVRVSSLINRRDALMLFNPIYVETIFRNEGPWPVRDNIKSLHKYRTVTRKERFGDLQGLITSQGEIWQSFRSKVNQPLMQPRSARRYMPAINEVADDFIQRMREMRDENKELPADFMNHVYRWSLESIALVALDTRIGCLAADLPADAEPQRMVECVHTVINSFMELDIKPSLFRLGVPTRRWRRFVAALDEFHSIADKYVDKALADCKVSDDRESSILQRLAASDRNVASLMAADMLFAGVDTTSNAFGALLFQLAKNPDKQEKLREEVHRVLLTPKDLVTAESIEEMPFLKACLKESLRIFPLTAINMRATVKDVVVGGYQVPKGVDVLMGHMVMSRDERFFPRPDVFLPERWLRGNAGKEAARHTHPFVSLPFGFGVRTCVGRRFAELEMYTLTAKVIRNFQVEYHHGDELQIKSSVINYVTQPLKFRLLER